jgi:hypothetical protein
MGIMTPATGRARPFRPSVIDRFNHWVGGLPLPAWPTFAVFGLVLIGVQLLVLWLEDGLGEAELLPVIIYNGLFTPYLLALIYLLDNQAVSALRAMRSVLDTTAPDFDGREYRLATMRFPVPLVLGLAMVIVVILMELLATTPLRYGSLDQFRVFAVLFQIVDKSSAFMFGVFVYHTVRQLRLVSGINARDVRVDLFDRRPLQAFSTLTASTAVGLLVGVYGWMVINPDLLMDPVIFGFIAIMTVLAVIVFVWPLYGIHRRMAVAKEEALRRIDRRSRALFSAFDERIDAGDYAATEWLNGAITSLDIQHRTIGAIPTWPWRPEAARFLLAAIALPLVLELLLFLIGQALGG